MEKEKTWNCVKAAFSVLLRVLRPIYSHAIRYQWLSFNPISKVRTSSKQLREKRCPQSGASSRHCPESFRYGTTPWFFWRGVPALVVRR